MLSKIDPSSKHSSYACVSLVEAILDNVLKNFKYVVSTYTYITYVPEGVVTHGREASHYFVRCFLQQFLFSYF